MNQRRFEVFVKAVRMGDPVKHFTFELQFPEELEYYAIVPVDTALLSKRLNPLLQHMTGFECRVELVREVNVP